MNRVWTGEEKPSKSEYVCNVCHGRVFVSPSGYLPIHRHKGKRNRCKGSEDAAFRHQRIG